MKLVPEFNIRNQYTESLRFSDMKVFALLSKVSSQFDDQRGPLRKQDLELPDFLKPKPPTGGAGDQNR